MGRYDNVRVFYNNAWHRPTRMYVFNGNWQDIGTQDGENVNRSGSPAQRHIYVRSGNSNVRVTKYKNYRTEYGDSYTVNNAPIEIYPQNGYQFRTQTNPGSTFIFQCTVRKTAHGPKRLLWTGRANYSSRMYLEIWWEENGTISVHIDNRGITNGTGGETRLTSSNAVGDNTWATLVIRCDFRSTTMSLTFNGQTVYGNMWNGFRSQQSDVQCLVGYDSIQFKDTLQIQGTDYNGNTSNCTVNMSTGAGSSSHSNLSIHSDSYTVTEWL